MKILFVCSTNVCRSPYCEFMFRRMAENSPVLSKAGIVVKSAGVIFIGGNIFPTAVTVLKSEGFDEAAVLAHKPCFKRFCIDRFEEADVIIGMTRLHKLFTPAPYRKKFITLSKATGKYKALPDPFMLSGRHYAKAMNVIKDYLAQYAAALEKEMEK